MTHTIQRTSKGRFTSPETERRKAWAAMRETKRDGMLPIGCMTFVEHLGALQRAAEGRKEGRVQR
jgi:hypothetical protein